MCALYFYRVSRYSTVIPARNSLFSFPFLKSLAQFIKMIFPKLALVASVLVSSIAASPYKTKSVEKRGQNVIIGYRTVGKVRQTMDNVASGP